MNDWKHLVSAEFEKLMIAPKDSRNEARDRCLLQLMFQHGLRSALMAKKQGLPYPLIRYYMLRHGCGFALADQGADDAVLDRDIARSF